MNSLKKVHLEYDSIGREIEVTREGIQEDSVRFKEYSRTERYTGKTNKAIKRFSK